MIEGEKLRVLDLFSGIGGFSLGLERAGMRTVAFCEANERKRESLAAKWPGVTIFHDVRTLRGSEVAGIDVVCGGFPCQDLSLAGRRAGLAGQHSGLWAEFRRLVSEIRPRYAIVENVPGLLVRGIGTILGNLADDGYDAEWDCIPAAALGAPHLRARIWILAYPRGIRDEANDTIFAGRTELVLRDKWPTEPDASRVDDGVPGWMVGAYGDSLVPQIPEIIGRAILRASQRESVPPDSRLKCT